MPKITHSLGIIPARYASTRFPGKPLVEINGKSMIRRVYEQASKSMLGDVVVATDDERIYEHVLDFEGKVIMTSNAHQSGTDRCAEVASRAEWDSFDLILNVQGDEPYLAPRQINGLLAFIMENPAFQIATLAKAIHSTETIKDPNTVKVVFDKFGRALYFSRSAIPFVRGSSVNDWASAFEFHKHIGLYAFRKNALLDVAQMQMGNLESAESLEQLRWMENGIQIGIQLTDIESVAVDVPDDLLKFGNQIMS